MTVVSSLVGVELPSSSMASGPESMEGNSSQSGFVEKSRPDQESLDRWARARVRALVDLREGLPRRQS
jgi:hypothetical protein